MQTNKYEVLFLKEIHSEFIDPQFVTLLFEKRLFVNSNRTFVNMTMEEAVKTINVLFRRLEKQLYNGKSRLGRYGCIEINEGQRFHGHLY